MMNAMKVVGPDAGRDDDSGRYTGAPGDHTVHAAGTAPAGFRIEAAAVRRRLHGLRLQRADAAAARSRRRALISARRCLLLFFISRTFPKREVPRRRARALLPTSPQP